MWPGLSVSSASSCGEGWEGGKTSARILAGKICTRVSVPQSQNNAGREMHQVLGPRMTRSAARAKEARVVPNQRKARDLTS